MKHSGVIMAFAILGLVACSGNTQRTVPADVPPIEAGSAAEVSKAFSAASCTPVDVSIRDGGYWVGDARVAEVSNAKRMTVEPLARALQAELDKLRQERQLAGHPAPEKDVISLVVDKSLTAAPLQRALYTAGSVGVEEVVVGVIDGITARHLGRVTLPSLQSAGQNRNRQLVLEITSTTTVVTYDHQALAPLGECPEGPAVCKTNAWARLYDLMLPHLDEADAVVICADPELPVATLAGALWTVHNIDPKTLDRRLDPDRPQKPPRALWIAQCP